MIPSEDFALVTQKEFELAVVIIVSLVISKLISLLVEMFFKKITESDYVTKKECLHCKNSIHERRTELTSQIRIIKGILLIVAIKLGVDDEQLKNLIEK